MMKTMWQRPYIPLSLNIYSLAFGTKSFPTPILGDNNFFFSVF